MLSGGADKPEKSLRVVPMDAPSRGTEGRKGIPAIPAVPPRKSPGAPRTPRVE